MSRQNVRKQPQQDRSRQMVERILDAAARILVTSGYDGASTHRIAAEAGVSPGSLYQYFPNKDAVVAATVERIVAQIGNEFATSLDAAAMTDIASPTHIRSVVEALVSATEEHRELVRVLVEQMPRLGGSDEIRAIERRATDLGTGFLAGLGVMMPLPQRPAMVWIVVQALQHITIRYVLDRPPIDREEFVDELTHLVITMAISEPGGTRPPT